MGFHAGFSDTFTVSIATIYDAFYGQVDVIVMFVDSINAKYLLGFCY
jgi:hypothetical protein